MIIGIMKVDAVYLAANIPFGIAVVAKLFEVNLKIT